ncbi:hypothetical protein [Xylophilus sp. Leaf220]|uniref:hypothetical protein n=1 Tax=Xylophilus sp. Leaf220 TaxID=1735686 RepID=UPI0006F718DB|nr:hypothetical protein [Xylophilus sp. Leaf220]KQM70115.1 hypothetical protein ASE76_09880 [Xylophilus sp. Leaf220]
MNRTPWIRALGAIAAALLVAGCGGGASSDNVAVSASTRSAPAAEAVAAPAVTQLDSYAPSADPLQQQASPEPTRGARPAPARVALAPMLATQNTVQPRTTVNGPDAPLQIGSGRLVQQTATAAGMASHLVWSPATATTLAAAISFQSPGAAAVRIGLLVRKLPAGATLRVYAQGQDTAYQVSGREVLDVLSLNRMAGGMSDADRTYWLPPVDGDEATVEIVLPAGVPGSAVDVSVPQISHLKVSATADPEALKTLASGSCEIDVNCTAGNTTQRNATARMSFVQGANSYVCTGTLLNNTNNDGTPYFLSANHCISSQTVASTLVTAFFYKSSSCNSGTPASGVAVLRGGATLLYASDSTDTSFMRLNNAAPAGAEFAGWSLGQPAVGADLVGIHHPGGDLQKYAQGALASYLNCTSAGGENVSCSASNVTSGRYLNVNWSSGLTEGGSSGSGIFATLGGGRMLIGQLYAGTGSCTDTSTRRGVYGRFDTAFNAALNQWLRPAVAPSSTTRSPVYRFYNTATGAHFFTMNAAERDGVISTYPSFSYEGIGFYAYGAQASGTSPVYRFYNTQTGRHFYTISAAERDSVIASYPQFSYEGPSWYAQAGTGGNANAMYRFYSANLNTHFYTISASEKDFVVQTYPTYQLEGIAYYAWTGQ